MTLTNRFPILTEERCSTGGITLADVIERLRVDATLSPRRRDDLCSALRTLARAINIEFSMLPADPRILRQKLSQLSPAAMGISIGRWRNLRSLILAALKRAGVRAMPGRYSVGLSPAWRELHRRLVDPGVRYGLSRFIGYLSGNFIEPAQVIPATFGAFRVALETDSFLRNPRTLYRTTCKLWNRATTSVEGWPALRVDVPNYNRRYALPFSTFPESFGADTNAYLTSLSRPDPFDEIAATPARPITIKQRRIQILELASALVLRGYAPESITGLAALVVPTNAREILRFFLERSGGKSTARIHHLACILKSIGRRWVKLDDQPLEELGAMCRRLAVSENGMTNKNRGRLRQFDDEANIHKLVSLPQKIVERLKKSDRGRRKDAHQLQLALAIAILLVAAPRIASFTGMRIDQHIKHARPGAKGVTHVVIPGEETKTGEPHEFALPAWLARILDLFITHYRPRLLEGPSEWLFPNAAGNRRNTACFARQIERAVKQHTGLTMNAHLLRHLTVKLCYRANPGDMETPRRLLNHRSIQTTQRFYHEFDTQAAHARYDDILDGLRETKQAAAIGTVAPRAAGRYGRR